MSHKCSVVSFGVNLILGQEFPFRNFDENQNQALDVFSFTERKPVTDKRQRSILDFVAE